MISESPLVLIAKRGSGKLRRAAREVHLHQFDVKRPTRAVEELHQAAAQGRNADYTLMWISAAKSAQ